MIGRWAVFLLLVQVAACSSNRVDNANLSEPCAEGVILSIERKITTGDGEGHGPDIGSSEWYSVVERRLGIEGDASIPIKGTQGWCEYVISRF